MRYFNSYHTSNNQTYSCDMIRLKFEYKFENNYHLMMGIDSLDLAMKLGVDVQEYISFKLSGYRNLYTITSSSHLKVFDERFDNSYSFSIGLRHNMDTDSDSMTGFIEFNPNKCNLDVVRVYMGIIYKYANCLGDGLYFELLRFDMAIDIKSPRYALKLIKEGKRRYTYIQEVSLTEYLGKRNTDGFAKLYDKKVEDKLDYELTRLEITCSSFEKISLPRVVYTTGQYDMDIGLTDTDFVLVSLIRQQDEQQQQYYLSKLGRKKRDKLRPYIIGGSSILEYDKKGIMHVQDIVLNAMRMNF